MPTRRRKTSTMNHPVVITFLILAVIGFMSLSAEVLKPLALSVLLAFALTPVAAWLERRGVPRAPATLLTIVAALAIMGGIGYVVAEQFLTLAEGFDGYKKHLNEKVASLTLKPQADTAASKLSKAFSEATDAMFARPGKVAGVQDVRVLESPSFRERLEATVGPYLEFLGVSSFVLVLVLFMLLSREDLRDRILSLFGHSRVSLTTKTMDEIGQRISRYLATFATVNACFGLVIGLGLWLIGVQYAVLWGCLAALLRFVPYVGPAVAFLLPMVFSAAQFEGWRQTIEVFVVFAAVEVLLNSYLEPVIYGKTTGISALGLLVAAMFWTWLWGLLGLLLSTPLTVCLAVLGKYVPSLGIFATLLGEETELDPNVRFYQRLLALDSDGASEIVDEALKSHPRAEVFDTILVPALSHAERDASDGHIEEAEIAFVWRVVAEVIDDLDAAEEISLSGVALKGKFKDGADAPRVVGVAANDTADGLVLKMLARLLEPSGIRVDLIEDASSPAALAERIRKDDPAMVILSHLPPEGATEARHQVRKLRASFPTLPFVVGRWGASESAKAAAVPSAEAGVTEVAFSLAAARDLVIGRWSDAPPPGTPSGPKPVPVAAV